MFLVSVVCNLCGRPCRGASAQPEVLGIIDPGTGMFQLTLSVGPLPDGWSQGKEASRGGRWLPSHTCRACVKLTELHARLVPPPVEEEG